MCGFAGAVGNVDFDDAQAQSILSALEHRGPDSCGNYTDGHAHFFHTRLEVIDLSENAAQPMVDRESGTVLVYNGECYNYQQLRAHLGEEEFHSTSDTEVILRLYLTHGIEKCVSALRGMFAFAIWDPEIETLYLVRDRFGIKPLYYHITDEGIYFSSTIRGVLEQGAPAELNLQTSFDYLRYGLTADDSETFFEGIYSVPPASILRHSAGQTSTKQYWSLSSPATPSPIGDAEAEEGLWSQLKESVELHLVSDVPIGISLSSGCDSQFLVQMLGSLGYSDLNSFTYGYQEETYDEIWRVDKTEYAAPIVQHSTRLESDQLFETLLSAIRHFELPLGGLGSLSLYDLMKLPKEQGIKVLLTGEGSDEIFGGYLYYQYAYLRDLHRTGNTALLQQELDALNRLRGTNWKVDDADFQRFVLGTPSAGVRAPDASTLAGAGYIGKALSQFASNGEASQSNSGDVRSEMRRDLLQLKIPKLLWFADRASMAWGVEARVPFLDHKLVEYVYQLPSSLLFRNGLAKHLLRRVFQKYCGIALPEDTKHFVSTPQREWLKGPLYSQTVDYIANGNLRKHELIDFDAWMKDYSQYAQSDELGNSFFVWKVLNLEMLSQSFFRL